MDILIVGAGPTGLTAAVELARMGCVPNVIDKRQEPSGLSRAVGITPASLRLLAPSGVTEKLLQAGPALKGICGYFNDQFLLTLDFSAHAKYLSSYDYQTPLHCLPQDQTEAILTEQFMEFGGQVQYGTEFQALQQINNKVIVNTSANEAHYDHVIGADGIGSQVRNQLGLEFPGFDVTEPWSIADVDTTDWPHTREFTAFLMSSGHVCVAAPIGKNRLRLVSSTEDAIKNLPIPINISHVHRNSTFTVSVRQAERFTVGQVYLAGDAAHCHSPVGGRGMNLGIADAAQIANCIINSNCDNYHHLRHAAAADTINMTERGRNLLTSNSPVSRWIKPTALKLVNRSSFIKRKMIISVLEE